MNLRVLSVVVLTTVVGVARETSADSMRCGKRLVRDGQRTAEVRAACGTPTSAVQRVVGRTGLVIDEWSYDFGPHDFVRHLRFENDVLVSITSGEYGKAR